MAFVCELIMMCRESLAEFQLVEISSQGSPISCLHASLFPTNLFNIQCQVLPEFLSYQYKKTELL